MSNHTPKQPEVPEHFPHEIPEGPHEVPKSPSEVPQGPDEVPPNERPDGIEEPAEPPAGPES